MKNKRNIPTSLGNYCTEYLRNFNLRQLNASWRNNAVKMAAIAATSASFALGSMGTSEAQTLECPPAFNQLPVVGGPVTNPSGLSTLPDYYSSPTFVDYDGDGDLDIVSGDDSDIYLFTNTGSNSAPNWTGPVLNPNGLSTPGGYLHPVFVDIDNDGDLDAFIGTEFDQTLYFENIGTRTAPNYAAPLTNPFGIGAVGFNSSPAFADMDADGDFDLFIGDYGGDTFYYRNNGTATAPSFVLDATNPGGVINLGTAATPALSDMDNDGDLDLMIGNKDGDFTYFENTGTSTAPTFAGPVVNPFSATNVVAAGYGFSAPTFGDVDNDNDLDLLSGNKDGEHIYFENIGDAQNPSFIDYPYNLGPIGQLDPAGTTGANVGTINAIDYADMDADGDLDFFLATNGEIQYIENIGTATAPNFAAPTLITPLFTAAGPVQEMHPTLADLNGDGLTDLLIGTRDLEFFIFFPNTGTATNPNIGFGSFAVDPFGLDGTSVRTPEFVDLDGDGDQDIIAGVGDNTVSGLYFENIGTPTAPNYAAPVDAGTLGITGSFNRFSDVDIDGDGDFDLIVGDENSMTLYLNTGTPTSPNFVNQATNLGLSTANNDFSPTLVDIDQDGELEAFVGDNTNVISIYENNRIFPVISINETDPVFSCEANTLSVSSSNFALNDLTVTWYDANNNQVGTGSTFTLTSLASTTYSAVAKVNATGCASNQPTISVTQVLPNISITQGNTINSCETTTLNATSSNYAQSDLTYTWYNSSGAVVATGADFTIPSLDTESYSVKATTVTGCESNQPSINVVKDTPVISIVEGSTLYSCEDNTLAVSSSNYSLSDLNITWYDANNNVVGTGSSLTLPTLDSQTYSVKATTVTGCESNQPSISVVKNTPNILVTQGTSVFSCQPVTLTVESSNYLLSDLNFTWYDSDGNTVGTGIALEVDPLALPNYGSKEVSVVATSATGCESNTFNVSVACSDQVSITLSATAGYNSANLTWHTTGSRPVREYEVYGDPGQFGQYLLFGYSPTTNYDVVGLTNGQKVDFKVRPVYVDGDYGTYSNTVTVKPSIVLGEEDEQKAGFAFFPNPNNGEFSLKLQDGSTSAFVSVVSLSGQQVYTTTLSNTQTSINLGNVASGMYIVRVETAQGIYQQKVSVVR